MVYTVAGNDNCDWELANHTQDYDNGPKSKKFSWLQSASYAIGFTLPIQLSVNSSYEYSHGNKLKSGE